MPCTLPSARRSPAPTRLRQQRQRQRGGAAVREAGKQLGEHVRCLCRPQAALQQRPQVLHARVRLGGGRRVWLAGAACSACVASGWQAAPAASAASAAGNNRGGTISRQQQQQQRRRRPRSAARLQAGAGEQDEVEGLHQRPRKAGVLLVLWDGRRSVAAERVVWCDGGAWQLDMPSLRPPCPEAGHSGRVGGAPGSCADPTRDHSRQAGWPARRHARAAHPRSHLQQAAQLAVNTQPAQPLRQLLNHQAAAPLRVGRARVEAGS